LRIKLSETNLNACIRTGIGNLQQLKPKLAIVKRQFEPKVQGIYKGAIVSESTKTLDAPLPCWFRAASQKRTIVTDTLESIKQR
jgi:hypothetical protein